MHRNILDLRKEDINHLSTFGETLGMIFQLSDDYLDIFDNKNTLSKKIMQDLNTGDISLPILLAGEQTKNKTIEEIKISLNNHSKKIQETIKKTILEKNEIAKKQLSYLNASVSVKQLDALLNIITHRIIN